MSMILNPYRYAQGLEIGESWMISPAFGSLRNDVNLWVGCRFTVGGSNILIDSLARWIVSGNSQTHAVKITDLSGVTLASVSVDTTLFASGDWGIVSLSSPVELTASTGYTISSQEYLSGDQWYNPSYGSTVTSAAILGPPSYGPSWPDSFGGAAGCYVPCNFYYT